MRVLKKSNIWVTKIIFNSKISSRKVQTKIFCHRNTVIKFSNVPEVDSIWILFTSKVHYKKMIFQIIGQVDKIDFKFSNN